VRDPALAPGPDSAHDPDSAVHARDRAVLRHLQKPDARNALRRVAVAADSNSTRKPKKAR